MKHLVKFDHGAENISVAIGLPKGDTKLHELLEGFHDIRATEIIEKLYQGFRNPNNVFVTAAISVGATLLEDMMRDVLEPIKMYVQVAELTGDACEEPVVKFIFHHDSEGFLDGILGKDFADTLRAATEYVVQTTFHSEGKVTTIIEKLLNESETPDQALLFLLILGGILEVID